MVETGVVKKHIKKDGAVLVEFKHLGAEAECRVLQSTTGDNDTFILPSIGSQVVCFIEGSKYYVLGAIYSKEDTPPSEVSEKGMYSRYGDMTISVNNNKLKVKNNTADVKKFLKGIVRLVRDIQILTPQGPGKLDPTMLIKIQEAETVIDNLFE